MKKVALLVRSLERGGAERQLVNLARVLKRDGVSVVVIVFYPGGAFELELAALGIPVRSLAKGGRWDVAGFGLRFLKTLREESPDVLHGFVVSPNLLGSLVRPFFPKLKVVWGVRSARDNLTAYDWVTRFLYRLEGSLSRLPDLVIVNSQPGRVRLHERGFPNHKIVYIPNGIDADRYCPDAHGRERVRKAWGIGEGERVVGIVARADPVKGHEVFFAAARLLASSNPQLRFVCIGVDADFAANLQEQTARLGISNRVRLEGPSDDMPAIYSALDVNVMCSHSEGFPNVVAEAMACGVVCAVTDVGDAVEIVGETGESVPKGDPEALSRAVLALLGKVASEPARTGRSARARIVERYSLDALAQRTLRELSRISP